MAVKIQIRRGLKENLPDLEVGELGFATDTQEVFIGTETTQNVQMLTGTPGLIQEAVDAQKLKTPRTITFEGDVTGNFTFDGSEALTVNVQVENDSHTHDTRYYTETQLNNGQLNNLYYTENEMDSFLSSKVSIINIFSETDFASVTRVPGQVYGEYNETTGVITWYFGNVGDSGIQEI